MSKDGMLSWRVGGNLRSTYLSTKNSRDLQPYLTFHNGARLLLEKLALRIPFTRGCQDPHILHHWNASRDAFGITAAFLLYTSYYKDTCFVGPVEISGGKKAFLKVFHTDTEAHCEEQRVNMFFAAASSLVRTSKILNRIGPNVLYDLLEHDQQSVEVQVSLDLGLALGLAMLRQSTDRGTIECLLSTKNLRAQLDAVGLALDIDSQLMQKEFPLTIEHGDFTPWNLFYDETKNLCLIDYERVGLGTPYSDYFHFITQPLVLNGITDVPVCMFKKVSDYCSHPEEEVMYWYALYLLRQLNLDTQTLLMNDKKHKQIFLLIKGKYAILRQIERQICSHPSAET